MNIFVVNLLISFALLSTTHCFPLQKRFGDSDGSYVNLQSPRFNHLRFVDECVIVGLDETTYNFRSNGSAEVCALYFLGEPDENVQITIEYMDFKCEAGGLVTILDGWHMSGQTFPPEGDHQQGENFAEICDRVSKQVWTTSTNAATIMYRAPTFGDVFTIKISFLNNPEPCNVLLIPSAKMVTLRNFGRGKNCTVATTFPAVIKMVKFSVGVSPVLGILRTRAITNNNNNECQMNGFRDVVLVGGANGLDTSSMKVEKYFCGKEVPHFPPSHISCSVSAVTMISSGLYNNSVTVQLFPFGSPDVQPTTNCSSRI